MRHRAGAAILFGFSLLVLVGYFAGHPRAYWQQTDMAVYRQAGIFVRQGGTSLYTNMFGPARQPFTYPPAAALVFAAFSPLSMAVWRVVWLVVGVGSVCASAWASLTIAKAPAKLVPTLLIGAVALWLEPVDMTFFFGQINLLLLALVLVDLALPDRSRWKGMGTGIAAGLKLTPLIFVPYLLLTGRRRAAGVATLSFLGTVGVGFCFLPAASARYWSGGFARSGDDPSRLVDQSLNGLIHRLHGTALVWAVAAVILGILGLYAAVSAARAGNELLGICLCAATGLVVSPISWTHHWVFVIPALVLARQRILAAAAIVAVFAWWPLPVGLHGGLAGAVHPVGWLRIAPHDDGRELSWTGWQTAYGNGYLWVALAFVVIHSAKLAIVRRPAGADSQRSVRAVAGRAGSP